MLDAHVRRAADSLQQFHRPPGQGEQHLGVGAGEFDGQVGRGAVGILGNAVDDRLREVEAGCGELLPVAFPQCGDQLLLGPELPPLVARLRADHHLDPAGRERVGAVVIATRLHDGKLHVGELQGHFPQPAAILARLLQRRALGKIRADPNRSFVQIRQELGSQPRNQQE